MKKSMIFFSALTFAIFVFFIVPTAFSQPRPMTATTLKAGYFNPKGSKAGLIFGAMHSWIVDESVDIGLAVDFFHKQHTAETQIAQSVSTGGTVENEVRTDAQFTTNIVPIYGIINVKFPAGRYFDYFASGGLGYAMLFSKEQSFGENASKTSRFYSGFKWIVSGGFSYRIGSRSSFIGEVFYDGTKVSRDKKDDVGAPVRYEVDLSGLGFRIGIRMGFH
ncbi:MAG: hypothetical protein GXO74_08550 [Calditrichaeota bacterium]|nr:hypothetical protein [Calditrichota bacterium]